MIINLSINLLAWPVYCDIYIEDKTYEINMILLHISNGYFQKISTCPHHGGNFMQVPPLPRIYMNGKITPHPPLWNFHEFYAQPQYPLEKIALARKCVKEARKGLSLLYCLWNEGLDDKEGCLMVWANYMSPCNSIVGLYFKGTCDVISVTNWQHTRSTKASSKFQFL